MILAPLDHLAHTDSHRALMKAVCGPNMLAKCHQFHLWMSLFNKAFCPKNLPCLSPPFSTTLLLLWVICLCKNFVPFNSTRSWLSPKNVLCIKMSILCVKYERIRLNWESLALNWQIFHRVHYILPMYEFSDSRNTVQKCSASSWRWGEKSTRCSLEMQCKGVAAKKWQSSVLLWSKV